SFFFSSRRRHTRSYGDWSSDVCSSDLAWAGSPNEAAYFWSTGLLSAFLDNAPTYLVFFELAGGDPQVLMGPRAGTLAAISMGARSEERRVGKEGGGRWWAEPGIRTSTR